MFSSFFSTAPPVDPTEPNFHPVSSRYPPQQLCGQLESKDLEWTCAGGFTTETQTFYTITDEGTMVMCQVIHSAVGLWYPTIQFTFKLHDPKTGKTIWKSVSVTNFVTPPPNLDKRSCKGDQFSITYKSDPGSEYPESYDIVANLAADLQVSLEIKRPASIAGYKVGDGPHGGFSYFGTDPMKNPDGYVVHRFWPRFAASGHIISNGKADPVKGPGMFVHAIQGMRPNLIASRWNFAHFQSDDAGGVSAIQMEFTTCDSHGRTGAGSGGVVVNIGSLVVNGQLVTVTAETKWPDEEREEAEVVSRTTHLNLAHDPDTDYQKPNEILFQWAGPVLVKGVTGIVKGEIKVDLGDVEKPKGLIEKVDVLAEIPYVIKMAVNYVAGTKPFVYQWFNPGTLSLTGPLPELANGVEIKGIVYNEATFIS